MSYVLRNALIPTASGYETTDVRIEGEQIAAIGKGLLAGAPDSVELNADNKLLLPGFVNAHTHSSELWQRGIIPPYPLELWLAQLHEYAPPDPEKVYLSALATAVETLLSGGTTVVDHLILIPGQELATVEAAVRAYREVGIRAFIGPLLQDQALPACLPGGEGGSAAYPLSTAEVLAMLEEAVQKYHRPEEGISLMVAPTGIQLCSDKLFEGCAELSQKYNLPRHAHLLETRAQQLLAQEKYGCSAVEHLERLGYLDRKTSLAHCVWLTASDIEILARAGSTVVHNPLSNLRLGSGIAPILEIPSSGGQRGLWLRRGGQ
jgi:5-methylthioadenosine/S-adenosylhomocysteine deaminase